MEEVTKFERGDKSEHNSVTTQVWEKKNTIFKVEVRTKPIELENNCPNLLSKISSAGMMYQVVKRIYEVEEYDWYGREYFLMIGLNRANKIICYSLVSIGGISGTVADGKIIFRDALMAGCSSILLIHNHPSGKLLPSAPDLSLTKRFVEFGIMIDMPVLDHLIVTPDS